MTQDGTLVLSHPSASMFHTNRTQSKGCISMLFVETSKLSWRGIGVAFLSNLYIRLVSYLPGLVKLIQLRRAGL